jgi:predicted NBD/HSP70 family sugar kinase
LSKFSPKSPRDASQSNFTVLDLIALARGGDAKAIAAVQSTARFLGLGLAAVVNIINPGSIYLAGEIITAWDLIESSVREALGERALTEAAARTPLHIASVQDHPRLRGAAALIAAPTFAAPRVA